jgi:hypothetical protein
MPDRQTFAAVPSAARPSFPNRDVSIAARADFHSARPERKLRKNTGSTMRANGPAKSRFLNTNRGQNNGDQTVLFGKEAHGNYPKKRSSADETIGIIIAMFGGTVIENRKPERPVEEYDAQRNAYSISSGPLIKAQGGAAESLARLSATSLYKLCEL